LFAITTGCDGIDITIDKARYCDQVSAITNFSDVDPIAIIGDGATELNAVSGAPSGSDVVPDGKIVIAQASAARVLELVKRGLGHIAEGSARMTGSGIWVPITAATAQVPIGYLITGGNLGSHSGSRTSRCEACTSHSVRTSSQPVPAALAIRIRTC
jgi:hypothetical protein